MQFTRPSIENEKINQLDENDYTGMRRFSVSGKQCIYQLGERYFNMVIMKI